jgi:hypothetical protein
MNETEREAWAALEAGIVEDAAEELARLQRMMMALAGGSPHRCPNCDGSGKRVYPVSPTANASIVLYPTPQTCHSCAGKGVLWG